MAKRRPKPQGAPAAQLRQRKFTLVRRFQLSEELIERLLPGSLSETHRRCGKPTCHCAEGAGHPSWYLTFMVEGKKRVERSPAPGRRGPGVQAGGGGGLGGECATAGAGAAADRAVRGPTPRRLRKYVCGPLRLAAYVRGPGDGRCRP